MRGHRGEVPRRRSLDGACRPRETPLTRGRLLRRSRSRDGRSEVRMHRINRRRLANLFQRTHGVPLIVNSSVAAGAAEEMRFVTFSQGVLFFLVPAFGRRHRSRCRTNLKSSRYHCVTVRPVQCASERHRYVGWSFSARINERSRSVGSIDSRRTACPRG